MFAVFPTLTVERTTTSITLSWLGSASHGITSSFTVTVTATDGGTGGGTFGPYQATDLDTDGSIAITPLSSGNEYTILVTQDTDDTQLATPLTERTSKRFMLVEIRKYNIIVNFSDSC